MLALYLRKALLTLYTKKMQRELFAGEESNIVFFMNVPFMLRKD
jgi:hypothetical protein